MTGLVSPTFSSSRLVCRNQKTDQPGSKKIVFKYSAQVGPFEMANLKLMKNSKRVAMSNDSDGERDQHLVLVEFDNIYVTTRTTSC